MTPAGPNRRGPSARRAHRQACARSANSVRCSGLTPKVLKPPERRIFCAEPETFAPSAAVAHARLHRRPVAQPAYLYIVAVCESARSCRDPCARKLRRERRHLQGRGMTTFTELECNDVAGGCHLPGHDALMRLETGPAECSGIAAGQAVRPSGPSGRRRRSPRRLVAHRARVRWSPSCRQLVRPGRTGRRSAVRAGRL